MKYLFINSVAGIGSTGRIAADKCRELMQQGHECVLAYGRQKANCDDIRTMQIGSPLDFKLHGVMTRIFDNHGFASKAATSRFLEQVRKYDPDVIWLHNIHGYYIHIGLLFDYIKQANKKVIWTLHDCWSFTGHCAHFDFIGCDKWRTGCHHCPQKREYPASLVFDSSCSNYQKKKTLFTGVQDMTIVTPSKWLASLVKQSYLAEYPVEVVYNRINQEIFKPTPSDFRDKHELTDKIIILGVAGIWTEKKGLNDFISLAEKLDDRFKIVLVGVTPEQAVQLPKSILGIARTNSQKELAELYTAADLFVNPTYEDTYPTVNLEAKACGTRIICYDTCGCKETLGLEDILVPKGKIEVLYNTIVKSKEGYK